MKIKMRWSHDFDNGATIQEFARMEMRPAVPNRAGVFEDHIAVLIPSASSHTLIIHIALGDDGYHMSVSYETPTGGGGSWPSANNKPYKTKEAAFKAGIKDLLGRDYLQQFKGYINRALGIYHSASYVQLTLF